MRKVLMTMFLFVIVFALAACGLNTKEDLHQNVFNIITIGYEDGDSINHVTKNVTLPTVTNVEGASISWVSTHPNILSNTGIVNRPLNENVEVTLTLKVEINKVEQQKEFKLTVIALSKFTVTFNSNGGSAVSPITVNEGEKVTKPQDPTKSGYNFIGWYKDEGLTTPWNFTADSVTNNVTLYAKWEEIVIPTHDVTFNSNGGSAVSPITVNEGDKVTKPQDPTKSGYNFIGWYKDEALTTPWNFTADVVTSNVTVYAKWEKITHEVTFNSNGGSVVSTITVNEGEKVAKPQDPTKAGYNFIGWYKEAALTTPWNFTADGVSSNVTLYAKWEEITHEVTFNANGGSAVSPITVNEGEKVTKPQDPTKSGYNFIGWYKDEALTTPWNFTADGVTSNVTLYAKWEEITHEVSFNSNGGSVVSTITVNEGEKVTKPQDPTKADHNFIGWYKDEALTTLWNFDEELVNSNVTLYAKWEVSGPIQLPAPIHGIGHQPRPVAHIAIGPYSFDEGANGGYTGYGLVFTNLTTGEVFTLRKAHAYNAGFATYYNESDLAPGIVLTPGDYKLEYFAMGNGVTTKDSDVSAQSVTFKIYNKYEVTLNSNGGSVISPITVNEGDKVTKPQDPTKSGYNFIGWYKDEALTTPWSFTEDSVTSNVTLYAKWTEIVVPTYEVTFNSNEGSVVSPLTVVEGEKVTKPQDPTKLGYDFIGWYTDEALTMPWNFEDVVTSDLTLYAKWEESVVEPIQLPAPIHGIGHQPRPVAHIALGPYSFVEGDNGGYTGYGLVFTNLTTGEVFTWRKANAYNAGFATHYNESDLAPAGIVLTPGDYKLEYFAMGNGVTTTDSDVAAQSVTFKIYNIYNVTFNSNGGSTVSPITVNEGVKITKPQDPTKVDFNFIGWYKDEALTLPWNFTEDSVTSNVTLYAKWTEIVVPTYEVTFNSNEGSVVSPLMVVEGEKVTKPQDPTKLGYDFIGWYIDADLTMPWNFEDVVTSDLTLYAKWEESVVEPIKLPAPIHGIGHQPRPIAHIALGPYEFVEGDNGGYTGYGLVFTNITTGEVFTWRKTNAYKAGFATHYNESDLAPAGIVLTPGDYKLEYFAMGNGVTTTDSDVAAQSVTFKIYNIYEVTFNSNGGSAVSPITVNEGVKITKPQDPTKVDFNFIGWYKDEALTLPWNFTEDSVTSNVTLYAKWTEIVVPTYVVTFNSNEGSVVSSLTVVEGEKVTKPQDPTKLGYDFIGWYTDEALTMPWNFEDVINSDLTLYAKWEESVVEPIKLPAPIHGIGHQPRPIAHIALGPYSFVEGANGGYTGYGLVFTNLTTGEVFTWRKANAYNAGFATHYNESDLAPAGIVLTPGDYKLEYFAMGNGVTTTDSDVSTQKANFTIEKPQLSLPVLSLDSENKLLSWANVDYATSYEVYINDELQVGNASPFDLSILTEAGQYTLKVVAKADTHKSSEATISYIISGSVPQLATPTNFTINGFVLSWDAVVNAVGYKIIINDVIKQSSTNSYDLSQFNIGNQAVTVEVIASGNLLDYSDSNAGVFNGTLPELLPQLTSMTTSNFISAYLLNGVDGGHRKLEIYKTNPPGNPFTQTGWNKYIRIGIKVNGEMIYKDFDFRTTSMQMIHTPGSTTSFFGKNLPQSGLVEIHLILVGDNVTYRDSKPLILTMNWNR